MDCPACSERVSPWRVLIPRLGRGWRCRSCDTLFYLDRDDYERGARPAVTASIGVLFLCYGVCAAIGLAREFPLLLYLLLFAVWHPAVTLHTRTALAQDARSRRWAIVWSIAGLTAFAVIGPSYLLKAIYEPFRPSGDLFDIAFPGAFSCVFFYMAYRRLADHRA